MGWAGRLKDQFLNIFAVATSRNMVVEAVYSGVSRRREWAVNVTKNLNDWKIEENENLLLMLSNIQLENHNDQLMLKKSKKEVFSVKTFYNH